MEARQRNSTRSTINLWAVAHEDVLILRAKTVLTGFMQKCGQVMAYKFWTYDWLRGFYHTQRTMNMKARTLKLKRNFLDLVYENELHQLKAYHYKNAVTKQAETFTMKLSAITQL